MKKLLATCDFDCLCGLSINTTSVYAASVGRKHSGTAYSNSFRMDSRIFCIRQKAIDLIERRVIPADSDTVCAAICGAIWCAVLAGATVFYFRYGAMISDNSLIAGLSLILL